MHPATAERTGLFYLFVLLIDTAAMVEIQTIRLNNNRVLRVWDVASHCVSYRCFHPHCRDPGSWSDPQQAPTLDWAPALSLYYSVVFPGDPNPRVYNAPRLDCEAVPEQTAAVTTAGDLPTVSLFIRAPKGSGKTYTIGRVVAALPAQASAVVVVPNRAMADQTLRQLGPDGFVDYRDAPGVIQLSEFPRVVTTLESLPRVSGGIPDVVVMDESETVLSNLPGATFDPVGRRARALDRLRLFLAGTRVFLALDAELSLLTYNFLQPERPVEARTVVHVNSHRDYEDDPLVFWQLPSHKAFEAEITSTLAKFTHGMDRLVLASNSKKATDWLRLKVKRDRPDLRVLVINRSTKDQPQVVAAVQDADSAWVEWDVVAFSPTVGTGIDFNAPNHFNHIFVVGVSGSGTARDLEQQVGRTRAPGTRDVYMLLPLDRDNVPSNPDALRSRLTDPYLRDPPTDVVLRSAFSSICDRFLEGATDQRYLELHIAHAVEVARSRNNFAGQFMERILAKGGVVDDEWGNEDPKEEDSAAVDLNAELKAAAVAEFVAAAPSGDYCASPASQTKAKALQHGVAFSRVSCIEVLHPHRHLNELGG